MIGVEFTRPGFAVDLMNLVRTMGVITLPSGEKGEVLSLTPPLTIEKDLLFKALDLIAEAVERLDQRFKVS